MYSFCNNRVRTEPEDGPKGPKLVTLIFNKNHIKLAVDGYYFTHS
jgi:hypothetical protein